MSKPRFGLLGDNLIPCLLCFTLLTTASSLTAQDENPAPVQPTAESVAERDFQFQGEYVGSIGGDRDPVKIALQVIAIGDGQFKVVAYKGGLPGDGWDGSVHDKVDVIGTYDPDSDSVSFTGYGDADAVIKDDVLKITTKIPGVSGTLHKVVRQSETLGAQPEEGATVLFDGTQTEQWHQGRITDDGLLMQGTTSKKKFGDHKIHIEFRLPFMPKEKGQRRGNSGIYVQGRYEIQMLDSFGLEGKQNECGGIYSIKAPDVNMCLPPMSWQTYDIDFTAATYDDDQRQVSPARITVRHNGTLIHDNVELPERKTTAAPFETGPEPGPLYLQNHGNEVRYRNIWVQSN